MRYVGNCFNCDKPVIIYRNDKTDKQDDWTYECSRCGRFIGRELVREEADYQKGW